VRGHCVGRVKRFYHRDRERGRDYLGDVRRLMTTGYGPRRGLAGNAQIGLFHSGGNREDQETRRSRDGRSRDGCHHSRLESRIFLGPTVQTSVPGISQRVGHTQRRRLNRGGERQANAALYRITLSRFCWDQRTQDYLRRRLGEGKTRREAIRCLSDTSPARCSRYCAPQRLRSLDIHRGICDVMDIDGLGRAGRKVSDDHDLHGGGTTRPLEDQQRRTGVLARVQHARRCRRPVVGTT